MKIGILTGTVVLLCAARPGVAETIPITGALKHQLVGSWELVSNSDRNSDGSLKWGENPRGGMIFDATGRYAFIIVRADLPRIAANSMDKGTPEENAKVVHGSFANFGSYSVDEEKRTFTTYVEGSIFPNITGRAITRLISFISPDEIRYTNAMTATGASAEAVWRRTKSNIK